MVKRYVKKPAVIEAIQFDGTNFEEIREWAGCHLIQLEDGTFEVPTLEGNMHAAVGDYIICGVKNDYYPCKPDIFDMTYWTYDEWYQNWRASH